MLSSEAIEWLLGLMVAVQEEASLETDAVEGFLGRSNIQRCWKMASEVKSEVEAMQPIDAIAPVADGKPSMETLWTTKSS